MAAERVQKLLAHAGVASRREAEEMIRAGRVTVNGQTAAIGDKADPTEDSVKVDGKRIQLPDRHHYLLLNKPVGYMSTRHDPEGRPTVMKLIPAHLVRFVVPVGRLDFATEGLLFLTDDGDLAFRVGHPRYGCKKTYEVKVKGEPSQAALDELREGIFLEGKRTRPAEIEPLRVHRSREGDNTWWTVVLSEGRTRQIREMFFRIGHPVQRLRRVGIGPIRDPLLPAGAVRDLTTEEVLRLRYTVGLDAGDLKPRPRRSASTRSAAATRPRRPPKGGEGGK